MIDAVIIMLLLHRRVIGMATQDAVAFLVKLSDFLLLTLSVLYRCLVLFYCGLCGSGKGCCCGIVSVMNQVAGHHAVENKNTVQRS